MTGRRSISIEAILLTIAIACLLATTVGAGSAYAAEPWWHVSGSSRPSMITPGAGHDEVQDVTVKATGGEFWLFAEPGPPSYVKYAAFAWNATAQEVEQGLEGIFGSGNVKVAGGPGDATGSKPYVITFTGALTDHLGALLNSFYSEGYSNAFLTGTPNEAKVTEQTVGRPDGTVMLLASNLGTAPAGGVKHPITISDTLPPGLKAIAIKAQTTNASVPRAPVGCVLATLTCTFEGELPAYESIEVQISVAAQPGTTGSEVDVAHIEGGGASAAASGSLRLTYGEEPSFGVQDYELTPEAEGGTLVTQAGAHPFQLTTTAVLNQDFEGKPFAMSRDLEFNLPPGLLGNPNALPQCSLAEFLNLIKNPVSDECRPETAVGVAIVTIRLKGEIKTYTVPVFNLEPEHGEPARFGFYPAVPVVLDVSVRTGGDYGVTVSAHNLTQLTDFLSSQVTFWGVPGNPVHDQARGWGCLRAGEGETGYTCKAEEERNPAPFLMMPTFCSGEALQSYGFADTWQQPGSFEAFNVTAPMRALDSCNQLLFNSQISVVPDVQNASTPTGLTVDVHVPQDAALNPEGTAESAVKRIEVTLPQGVTVNPGGADGLTSCTEHEIGYQGKEEPEKEVAFEHFTPDYPSCPDSSKIATVKIKTPLLPNPLEGFVYLATPSINGELGDNPFNSLIAMYLVAQDPVSGFLAKLPMEVSLNPTTGQLVSKVDNPELPFEDAELHFFGGSRAPLVTPGLCGSYATDARFTPWSGNEAVHSTATFTIGSGPNGSPCPTSPKPFTPGFQAGTTNLQAGAYTPFTATLGHPDEDQALNAVSMTLPPGLMGSLSNVKLCPEPQASQGTCGPESLIGHTVVTAGVGSTPAVVARPGNVYITGPYNGHGACKVGEGGCAPFGLSIANPAETGPFDLEKGTPCDCIVVRAKVEVDPLTARLRIVSGPLPTMLKGIALDLQHVNVTVDRPGFTFNPTNCAKMAIAGTIGGAEGASAPVSSSFQVANCATLGFKPKFTASTSAKTSRKNGASLNVKLSFPKGSMGKQANIAKVKVDLPKQLPSNLPTLQRACVDSVFDSNPAACPGESRVGSATASTPLLPVSLSGPAYFVSHGGAKFPELIIVLQGYGVTVDLHGETFISKAGITSSTFNTVPDVPVGSFELTLPQGKYSALAAPGGHLCESTLTMPTAFTAQNGATLKQSTPIEVTGCPYALLISSKSVKQGTLTLNVSVPQAGKLTATGRGLTSAAKSASGRQTLTLTLKERKAGKLRTSVLLRFTPAKGKQRKALRKSITVTFR